MNSTKITHVHVYIIGAVLAVLLGVGLYFALVKPLLDSNVLLKAEVDGIEQTNVSVDNQNFTIMDTWEVQKKAAEDALQKARDRQASKAAQLARLESKKQFRAANRRLDIGDASQAHLLRVTMPRWLNLPRYTVQMMNSYARSAAARRRVAVSTTFAAPAPSTNPGDIPKDIVAWNLGTMTVTGDFNRVMQWVEDWNQAPLLVSVDNLKCSIAGRAGWVTATANLTVFVFPTGKAVEVPANAGTTAAPADGGGGTYPGGNSPS